VSSASVPPVGFFKHASSSATFFFDQEKVLEVGAKVDKNNRRRQIFLGFWGLLGVTVVKKST